MVIRKHKVRPVVPRRTMRSIGLPTTSRCRVLRVAPKTAFHFTAEKNSKGDPLCASPLESSLPETTPREGGFDDLFP